jgi:hypothetical protein
MSSLRHQCTHRLQVAGAISRTRQHRPSRTVAQIRRVRPCASAWSWKGACWRWGGRKIAARLRALGVDQPVQHDYRHPAAERRAVYVRAKAGAARLAALRSRNAERTVADGLQARLRRGSRPLPRAAHEAIEMQVPVERYTPSQRSFPQARCRRSRKATAPDDLIAVPNRYGAFRLFE